MHYCDTECPSIPTTIIGGGGTSTLATVKKIKVLFINDIRCSYISLSAKKSLEVVWGGNKS